VSVVDAVRVEVAGYGDPWSGSALAATALALAAELDDAENSATSKSMCAKALMDALEQLRALAPAREESDQVDEVAARRRDRRAARKAAAAD
jgi:hypothetical protein